MDQNYHHHKNTPLTDPQRTKLHNQHDGHHHYGRSTHRNTQILADHLATPTTYHITSHTRHDRTFRTTTAPVHLGTTHSAGTLQSSASPKRPKSLRQRSLWRNGKAKMASLYHLSKSTKWRPGSIPVDTATSSVCDVKRVSTVSSWPLTGNILRPSNVIHKEPWPSGARNIAKKGRSGQRALQQGEFRQPGREGGLQSHAGPFGQVQRHEAPSTSSV